MKNIEKHIDYIAELFGHFADCSKCPCFDECAKDDKEVGLCCGEFFKRWALEECDNGKEN